MTDPGPPKISVIMNCFNGETYLREAVESALAQSYRELEIIFWDNQSTDRSAEIVRSYSDSRIRYFYADRHTTLGEGRNLAVAQASGEWIGFLDCDDIWLPNKLSEQVALIQSDPSNKPGIVYGRSYRMQANLPDSDVLAPLLPGRLPEGKIFEQLLTIGDFIPLVSALVLRAAYHAVGGVPDRFQAAEDYYLFVAIAERYETRAQENFCSKVRIHGNNLTHRSKRIIYLETIEMLNQWKDQIPARTYRARMRELHTQIGFDTMVFGKRYLEGLKYIVAQGSPSVALAKAAGKLRRKLIAVARAF